MYQNVEASFLLLRALLAWCLRVLRSQTFMLCKSVIQSVIQSVSHSVSQSVSQCICQRKYEQLQGNG